MTVKVTEFEIMEMIHLAYDRAQWKVRMHTVMHFWSP